VYWEQSWYGNVPISGAAISFVDGGTEWGFPFLGKGGRREARASQEEPNILVHLFTLASFLSSFSKGRKPCFDFLNDALGLLGERQRKRFRAGSGNGKWAERKSVRNGR
jgi:hypothetical protein